MSETFHHLYSSPCVILDPVVSAKLDDIIAKYNCFTEEPYNTLREAANVMLDARMSKACRHERKHHHHGHHGHHGHHHGGIRHQQSTTWTSIESPLMRRSLTNEERVQRDVISLTNKVNGSNKDIIWQKLRTYVGSDNASEVAERLLECCAKQHAYVKVYMMLLQELHAMFPEVVLDQSRKFMDSFSRSVNDDEYMLKLCQDYNVNSEYDAFCKTTKERAYLLSRCRVVMYLFTHDYMLKSHASELLIPLFRRLLQVAVQQATYGNGGTINLLVELLIEMVTLQNDIADEMLAVLPALQASVNSKLRFRLQDFAEHCNKNNKPQLILDQAPTRSDSPPWRNAVGNRRGNKAQRYRSTFEHRQYPRQQQS